MCDTSHLVDCLGVIVDHLPNMADVNLGGSSVWVFGWAS